MLIYSDCNIYKIIVVIRGLLDDIITILDAIDTSGNSDLKTLVDSLKEFIQDLIIYYDDVITQYSGSCTTTTIG